jgi:hypothetical protein
MNQPAHPAFGPAAASAVPGAFPGSVHPSAPAPVRAAAQQQPPRPGRPGTPAQGQPPQRPQAPRPPAQQPPAQWPQHRPQPSPAQAPLAQRPPVAPAQRGPQAPQQRPQVAPPLRPVQRPDGPQRPQAAPAPRAPQRSAAPRPAAPARQAAPVPVPAGPPAPPAAPAEPESLGPPPRPRKRKIGGWIAVLVILGGLGGAGWYATHTAPASAAVGDCLAQTGGNELTKVGCGDPSARFEVLAKLENKTMVDASLDACADVPKATSSYWEGKSGELGLVLCLAPVEPVAAPKK